MSRVSVGPKVKQHTRCLLEALLAYANYELEDCDRLQIQCNWQTDNQLVVRTKVRCLEELTTLCQGNGKLNKDQIKEALKRLEDFLGVLEDNRSVKQGSEDWHFTLKLWYKRYDKRAILKRFDMEWENRRSEKSKQVSPDDSNETKPNTLHRRIPEYYPLPMEIPEGPVALTSAFYVDRPPIESRCYQTITQPGALIRIKAPKQMGKTSLLDRILDRAAEQGYQTVRLNFLQAETDVFGNLDRFLRWFCARVCSKLHFPSDLCDYWDEDRGSIVNCTTYFEAHLLEQIDTPLVLALDEVDWIFQSPEIAQGFFPMLRSWHEEAKTIDIWEQLRLVVVHSTEDYGPLDINQSPFNVGLPIELTEFTSQQVADLARRHKLNWNDTQVQQLMAMVGGHPYLVRLALYLLAQPASILSSNGGMQSGTFGLGETEGLDGNLQELLQNAPTDAGIYNDHLRRYLITLQDNPELAAALQQVIAATEPIRLETMQAYKLYSMGLIRRQGDRVTPRCQLYRQYFRERLGN